MTDQVSTTAPAAGQPQTPNASETEQKPPEQQPLDEARVRVIAEEIATKRAQSLVDKAVVRLSKQAQDQINALDLNQKTLGLDDKQVSEAKQKIVMNDLTAKPEGAPASASTQPASQAEVHPLLAETAKAFAKAGIEVTKDDPEFKGIQDAWSDPTGNQIEYAAAVAKAIADKKARVASNDEKASLRASGGGGGGTPDPNDISKITDSAKLYEIGDQQMRKGKK